MDQALLEKRRQHITGTDVAAILGVSRWKTALDVYAEKLNLVEPTPDNEAMYWGREIEPVIATRYAREHGVELEDPGFLVHPLHPYWAGIPDRKVKGQPVGLEIKTTGLRNRDEWGEPGTDQVPEFYIPQAAWYAPLLDVERMDFAVLIGGQDYREYTLKRDLELEALLVEAVEKFLHDHLEPQVPPEMTEPQSAERYLRAKYPRDTAPLIVAGEAALAAAAALREARTMARLAARTEAEAEARVKALIGEAAGLDCGELGKLTWKTAKGRRRLDEKALVKAHPEIAKEFTVQSADSRRFCVPRGWADDDQAATEG